MTLLLDPVCRDCQFIFCVSWSGPVALFSFLLTSVIWLSQSLRLLDLVINRGQSAPTFVYLTLLILPGLLVIILPLAYFFGTLYGLHKLNADSELRRHAGAGLQPGAARDAGPDRGRRHDGADLSLQPVPDAARPARVPRQGDRHPRRYRRRDAQRGRLQHAGQRPDRLRARTGVGRTVPRHPGA